MEAHVHEVKSNRGFSLIELIVLLAVVGILSAAAVPSFGGFVTNLRLNERIGNFTMDNYLARSESVTRGATIVICKSVDSTSTTPSCGDDSVNWEDGWVVFVNTDRDTPPVIDAGEDVLRVGSSLDTSYTLRPSNGIEDAVIYNSMGEIEQPGLMVLCKQNRLDMARVLMLQTVGRIKLAELNDSNVPVHDDGEAFETCDPA